MAVSDWEPVGVVRVGRPRIDPARIRTNAEYQQRHRNVVRAATKPRFVQVDGEGITYPDGKHEYVLLSVGQRSMHRNGRALRYDEVFTFLYRCFLDDTDAVYTGYYLGYDWSQWLRTLPEHAGLMLFTPEGRRKRTPRNADRAKWGPFPVREGAWEFDLLTDRRFKLRRREYMPDGKRWPWMYICDVGAFFQTAFVKTIDPAQWTGIEIATPDERRVLEVGKARRGHDTAVTPELIEYNVTENVVLGRVMDALAAGFQDIGIRLQRTQWFGPGQCAQKWLDNIGAITAHCQTDDGKCGECYECCVPDWFNECAIASYYGGWFEIFRHGHVPGTVHHYDINSAYPTIIQNLPCLIHAKWKRHDGFTHWKDVPRKNCIVHLVSSRIQSSKYVSAMPVRDDDGRIFRPAGTTGWYWSDEVRAAINAGCLDPESYCNGWVAFTVECDCVQPLSEIAGLYEHRLSVGKNTIAGKADKLVYNSVYGKFAQSIGMPKYGNPIYASLITAGCRRMILEAIATHPYGADDVLMVATDGIVFGHEHPFLPLSNKLGEWEHSEHTGLCLVAPGIYWDDAVRERIRKGEDPGMKSRGIPAKDLADAVVVFDGKYRAFDPVSDRSASWPVFELPLDFTLVTPEQAVQGEHGWAKCGHVETRDQMLSWLDGPPVRHVDSCPAEKRDIANMSWVPLHDGMVLASGCYNTIGVKPFESVSYESRFGTALRVRNEVEDKQLADGPFQTVMSVLNAFD